MLQTLLDLISTGQGKSQQELARALNVSETLVMQMTEQLGKQGYLIEAPSCAGGCQACSLKSTCGAKRQLRVWTLTDKGRSALDKSPTTKKA